MNKDNDLDFTSIDECQICAYVPKIIQAPLVIREWSSTKCCNKLICTSCHKKTEQSCPFCRHGSQVQRTEITIRVSKDEFLELLRLLLID
jgi:hypothetical protein